MNIFMDVFRTTRWSTFNQFMNSSTTAWSAVILGTSTAALAGLSFYRWNKSDGKADGKRDASFEKIQARVSRAYSYVFGGFGVTALGAIATHVSGISNIILQNRLMTIPIFLTSLVALTATLLIDKDNDKTKHVAWAIFNVSMGMTLSPLGFLNQKIVAQAAAISLGLGAALTLCVHLAPDREFLAWEGPLMTTLASISIASAVACFFPGSAFAYGIDRVSLYGGLLIFSGLLMSSTQRLIKEAETQSDAIFDPINSAQNVYLDGLNIFIRVLRIMIENKQEEN